MCYVNIVCGGTVYVINISHQIRKDGKLAHRCPSS